MRLHVLQPGVQGHPANVKIQTSRCLLAVPVTCAETCSAALADPTSQPESFNSPPTLQPPEQPSPISREYEIRSPSILGARPASQGSSMSHSTTHQGLSPSSAPPVVPFTSQEAVLMRNFIENMASWVRLHAPSPGKKYLLINKGGRDRHEAPF